MCVVLLSLAADPIIATTQRVYGVAAIPEDEEPEYGHLVIITEAGVMNTLQLYQQEQVNMRQTCASHSSLVLLSKLIFEFFCAKGKTVLN